MYSPNLVKLPNWMCFKSLEKKQPMNPHTGFAGSVTTVDHWATFKQARQAVKQYNFGGISFVFQRHQKIVGIDIDKCVFNGVISDSAMTIVKWFNTYTTYSASGTGLHLYLYGEIPKNLVVTELDKLAKPLQWIGAIEVYGWGKAFAETGQQVSGTPLLIQSDGGKLKQLYTRLGWQPPRPIQRTNTAPSGTGAVDYACKVMGQTLEGGRNATLNKQAFWLGQLVGGGQLNQSDCEPLKQVALNQGLEPAEVEKTFTSGFNDGLLKPIFPKPTKIYGKKVRSVPIERMASGTLWRPQIIGLPWDTEVIQDELNELFPEYQPATQPDQQTRLQAYQNGPQTVFKADKVQTHIDSPIADLMALANSLGGELSYTEQFTF